MEGTVRATLQIDDLTLEVIAAEGRNAVSETFRWVLDTRVADAVPEDLVGKTAVFTWTDAHEESQRFEGYLERATRRPRTGVTTGAEAAELRVVLVPHLAALWVGRDSRVHQDVTVVDLAKAIFERRGIDAATTTWSVGASLPTHPYRAQHRESDGETIARLLAEEGVYFAFEPTADATLCVFADDSTVATDLEGGASLDVLGDSGLVTPRPHVWDVVRTSRLGSSGVRLRDYDPQKPALELDAEVGDAKYELYDHAARFEEPSVGKALAEVRLEAARALLTTITGNTSSARVWPGRVLEVVGHERASLDGKYFVVAVETSWSSDLTVARHAVRFTAIPAGVKFRPPRKSVPAAGGPQTGIVVGASGSEIHPDDKARVRVQHYWDREGKKDDKASTWMRVGQFPLSGSMLMPRVGWDVICSAHEGDADQPFVAGHLYDGVLKPPYALPANKTRTAWQTPTTPGGGTSNEIRFEDKAGSEEMFINSSFDMNVAIDNEKVEKVGVDFTHTIGANHKITIASAKEHGIKTTQTTSIGGSETITISSGRETVVSGAETDAIGGSRTVIAIGGSQLDAGGGRTLTIGGSQTAIAAEGISRTALGTATVSVGGSQIQLTGAGVSDAVGGASAENVGAAKISIAGGAYNVTTTGALAENVGGAYIAAAGGNAAETSAAKLTINVGGAFLGNAPQIEVSAKSSITIRAGGASITIKPSKIVVKAPAIGIPAAGISKSGANVKHN